MKITLIGALFLFVSFFLFSSFTLPTKSEYRNEQCRRIQLKGWACDAVVCSTRQLRCVRPFAADVAWSSCRSVRVFIIYCKFYIFKCFRNSTEKTDFSSFLV